jgi:hypothetical protein
MPSAPAQKYDDKRAEQPITTETSRSTRPTDPTKIRLARSNCLSVNRNIAEVWATNGGVFCTSGNNVRAIYSYAVRVLVPLF